MEPEKEQFDQPDFSKLVIATVVGVLLLGGAVYAAYRYSQKQAGNIVLPGGVTYLGPSPATAGPTDRQPPTAPLRFTAASDVAWLKQSGKIYPYTFSYPSTLPIVVFPGDGSDKIAIAWGNIPPQYNILLNIEFISSREPIYLNLPKIEYVRNWYKFFSGLKGVKKVEPFTNTNGLKGYKASYIDLSDQTPNTNVFFEVPNDPNLMILLANGILDPPIFDRIVDSLSWNKPAPKSE